MNPSLSSLRQKFQSIFNPGIALLKVLTVGCAMLLLPLSCSVLSLFEEKDDFIKVRGTQFVHKGKPYYFVGTNLWYGFYLGSPGEAGDRPRLLRELDSLKSLGVDNLRILGASEESYMPRAVKPAIQSKPGEANDTLLQGMDFLLAEMGKRHLRAVIYLNNYWEWSGGMAQYNVWTGKKEVNPDDTTQGWGRFMDFCAEFYSNDSANTIFREYVKKIVTRKNSCNGRQFSEDPTIMSWQLANEPRPGKLGKESERRLPAYYEWINSTAFYIHSLDTNHLVSSGSEGSIGSLASAEFYMRAHQTPQINYLTMHLWPFNWKWFDPKRIGATILETESRSLEYLNSHFAYARSLGKPIVLEEFGLGRDGGRILPKTSTTARDRFYRYVYGIVYDSARGGAPIAGSNFWAWGGEGGGKNPDGFWKRGDPFMGDPPQEPQGMNSIYVSDSSTVDLVRRYSFLMSRLGKADSVLASAR
jgi:mannan endo-1,4-beta-mannosidase